MLMSDDCDSLFDISAGLLDKRVMSSSSWALSEDDLLPFAPAPVPTAPTNNNHHHHNSNHRDPFLSRSRNNSLKLSMDRQASLDDLATVLRAEAGNLDLHALNDGADTIQDLAKYLKDDSGTSPSIGSLIASATPITTTTTAPDTASLASVHNYASRPPSTEGTKTTNTTTRITLPMPIQIKRERPDTPPSDLTGGDSDSGYPSLSPFNSFQRRKRPAIIYKPEPMSEDDEGYEQERDADLPPPRKYTRKNVKNIKWDDEGGLEDMDEYRKRRERNNEAVRRARAKKRALEAALHAENRTLRADNSRLKMELEACRAKLETAEKMVAQLRKTENGGTVLSPLTSPCPTSGRVKKTPRRLLP